MHTKVFVISEFDSLICVVLTLAFMGACYFLLQALKQMNALYFWFRANRGQHKVKLPTPIRVIVLYKLLFWGGLGLASIWVLLGAGRDLFLSFEQVTFNESGLRLKYYGIKADDYITWNNIQTFKIQDNGRTTAILEIKTKDGVSYDSCRGNTGTLSDIVHEIKNALARQHSIKWPDRAGANRRPAIRFVGKHWFATRQLGGGLTFGRWIYC